jgi:acyl carrier protein
MRPDKQEIAGIIAGIIRYITRDWGLDIVLEPGTRMVGELGFTSMEFIELMAKLDIHFQRKLPYEDLMVDGGTAYRQELTIEELTCFVDSNFDVVRQEAGAL